MNEKLVLFVEDDAQQQDLFLTAVSDWNQENKKERRSLVAVVASDFEQGRTDLERTRFDFALLDLRIPDGRPGQATAPAGNELAHQALKESGIPIAVISADLSVLDPALDAIPMIKSFPKGKVDPYKPIIEWIVEQWTMMDILGSARRRIRASAADIFVQRVWPRWSDLSKELEDRKPIEIEGVVTRQYVSHIADFLGLDDPENAKWHPFENYVIPALHPNQANTGDIFRLESKLWVVMTPQCDMATKSAKDVILVECEPGIKGWSTNLSALKKTGDQKSAAVTYFKDLVNQNVGSSMHFLPPLPGDKRPLYVRFKKVRTISLADLELNLANRVASVSPPFLGNLIQRFGAHISRTGQPNIHVEYLQ